jgi:dolichyl-phosphate-mannose-protein mannosyltransferase
MVRLEHILTDKRLHSHDVRPPISEVDWQNEVSAYGFPGFDGDANDYFVVDIVKDYTPRGVARERLRYATSV